ncbi:MAG: NUDIX hydrolase [Edafosvirus sp.]|uniref:NUDIX hydrolase n=1 Tax=Edafosvirus sp. TaxID=2487765 RepID=A0A3G4ZSY1_9VIRU|nr:MAG: NUDIX hydrolase [Edafosvirus sp.]
MDNYYKYVKYKNKYLKLKYGGSNSSVTSYGIILLNLNGPEPKILMVRRRETFGYTDFVRGKYDPDDKEKLTKLFEEMTVDEYEKISKNNFQKLWDDKWLHNDKKNLPYIKKEYFMARDKFNRISNLKYYLHNVKPKYNEKEWQIPKGWCNKGEKNLECAIREFKEETGLNESDIEFMSDMEPLVENRLGTDGKRYKYIYYVAKSTNNKIPSILTKSQKSEIDTIKYFSCADVPIRFDNPERRTIIEKICAFYRNINSL